MNSHDLWQVEVQGIVYEASIEEIIEWIDEGSILPDDKIRKGSLRWLKADKVPELYNHFKKNYFVSNSKITTSVNKAVEREKNAGSDEKDIELIKNFMTETVEENQLKFSAPKKKIVSDITQNQEENALKVSTGCCSRHTEVEAQFICGTCLSLFCKVCPSSFGGNVKICLDCGAMCRIFTGVIDFKSVGAINKPYPRGELDDVKNKRNLFGSFSFKDFFKAIIYPFKFKTSLILGAIMFMILMLGQTAAAFGISMYFGAVICLMLANTLVFGCLANTLDNFSQGKTNLNFMPGFDDFEIWDDVIHPFLLCFGVYGVSFGLFFVLLFGALWQTSNSENKIEEDKQKIVSTVLPRVGKILNSGDQTLQSKQTAEQLNTGGESQNENTAKEDEIAQLQQNLANETAKFQKSQELLRQNLQVQTQTENEAIENEKGLFDHTIGTVLRLSLTFSVPIFIAFLWGIFYLPAACAVSGYTRSFISVINPLIAFDTMKRLGMDYFKLVVIFTAFIALGFVLNALMQIVLAPVNLPVLGNLPAKAIVSIFAFYLSIVFSIALGTILHKNAEKLNLRPR